MRPRSPSSCWRNINNSVGCRYCYYDKVCTMSQKLPSYCNKHFLFWLTPTCLAVATPLQSILLSSEYTPKKIGCTLNCFCPRAGAENPGYATETWLAWSHGGRRSASHPGACNPTPPLSPRSRAADVVVLDCQMELGGIIHFSRVQLLSGSFEALFLLLGITVC